MSAPFFTYSGLASFSDFRRQFELPVYNLKPCCCWRELFTLNFLGNGVTREQGWRSGESARLPPMWPGFESWRRRHMWVEFVVGSVPCSERFFSGYSGFPLSLKIHFQIPIRSGTHGHISTSSYELLSDPWVNKLQFTIYNFQLQLTSRIPLPIPTFHNYLLLSAAHFNFSYSACHISGVN